MTIQYSKTSQRIVPESAIDHERIRKLEGTAWNKDFDGMLRNLSPLLIQRQAIAFKLLKNKGILTDSAISEYEQIIDYFNIKIHELLSL
jgi:hypothetical protein